MMAMLRNIIPVFAVLQAFVIETAAANRPWKPRITVEAAEGIGRYRPELDPDVLKRFNQAYKEGEESFGKGLYKKARAALAGAIELRPNHVGARVLHAKTLLTLGYLNRNISMIKEARSDMGRAQEIAPNDILIKGMVELLDGLLKKMQESSRKTVRKRSRQTGS
jgi:tetratricopeptide (TPR) repeat protein